MVTVSREIIEHVLRTLEELKVAQEEIRSKLNADHYERGLPVYVIPAAGDYHRGYAHEVHATRPEPRKRMEEDEAQIKQEYIERTQNGAPNRNVRLQAAEPVAMPRNIQLKTETRPKTYEHPTARDRPRDLPADFERSHLSPMVDQRSPPTPIQRIIGEDRVCSPITGGRSQSPASSTYRACTRRYVRPRSATADIFWRQRQPRTFQERDQLGIAEGTNQRGEERNWT
jgi:hypothetical protein